jgi:hypothetical protein
MRGRTFRGPASLDLGGDGAYIYVGKAAPVDMPAFTGVIDPGLPVWVRTELDQFTPKLFAYYSERLGPFAGGRPTAYASWTGSAAAGTSMGGSVLKGTVILAIGGAGALKPSSSTLSRVRWFFGHESAHFWLGQTVRYDGPAQAWITEGGADMLAFRALEHLVAGYDARVELQRSLDECTKLVAGGKSLAGASARGDVRANYACGAVLLLAAEAAARKRDPHADVFNWMRGLLDARRSSGVVGEADWLNAFASVAAASTVSNVRRFIEEGVQIPQSFLRQLFDETGVPYRIDLDRLVLT